MATSNDVLVAKFVGILSATAFGCANLALSYIAVPCILDVPGHKAFKEDSEIAKRLAYQWQKVYNRGHKVGPASAVVSVGAFILAGAGTPQHDTKPRAYLFAAASFAALIIPFTLTIMARTNNELHLRADTVNAGTYQHVDNPSTSDLITKWAGFNGARALFSIIGAGCGVMTFFM